MDESNTALGSRQQRVHLCFTSIDLEVCAVTLRASPGGPGLALKTVIPGNSVDHSQIEDTRNSRGPSEGEEDDQTQLDVQTRLS